MSSQGTTADQRFEVGYSLASWELAGRPLTDGLTCVSEAGFPSYSTMVSDSMMWDVSRQYMRTGMRGPPRMLRDWEMLQRLGLISRSAADYGTRPAALSWHGEFVNPLTWPIERDVMLAVVHVLRGYGAPTLVLSGGPPPAPETHTAEGYKLMASRLEEIGAVARERGIRVAYHPHHDCFVENREQLDRLMDVLDTDAVGLCIDTGHMHTNGSDAVAAVRDYLDVMVDIHFKDGHTNGAELAGPARYAAFCELGTGEVDFPTIRDLLLATGYDGAVTLELDRPQGKTAEQACHDSAAFVKELGLDLSPKRGHAS